MGVIRQRNGECDTSAVALPGTVAGLVVLMVVLSGCAVTGHTSGHSPDVAADSSALSMGIESGSSGALRGGASRADSSAASGLADPPEMSVSDEASAAGSTSQQEPDRTVPGARVPGGAGSAGATAGAVSGEGSEVVDSSAAAQGVDKYLVPLPGQAEQEGVTEGVTEGGTGTSGSAGSVPVPAPVVQPSPSSTWQMPYRVVRYCGTVGTHEVGTSFFTDGTTGWTQKCLNQMAAAARASGSTLPQVSSAPIPAS